MRKTISIGIQGFSDLRERNCYFVDKTHFIKEWWENQDMVTLITRPRRFGKTLNMSMLECFFSNKYANRADLFAGLSIWEEEKYQKLQGIYPVIFLSFASVKAGNLKAAKIQTGRYDVMLVPLNQQDKAIVIEFKVHEPDEESSLQDTVQSALDQIKEKNYDAELLAQGIPADRIRHYGFAFERKKVLIG